MRLTEQDKNWHGDRFFKGKKKKCEVLIYFSATSFGKSQYWFYTLDNEESDIRYNSLWDNLKYQTMEECVSACEKN